MSKKEENKKQFDVKQASEYIDSVEYGYVKDEDHKPQLENAHNFLEEYSKKQIKNIVQSIVRDFFNDNYIEYHDYEVANKLQLSCYVLVAALVELHFNDIEMNNNKSEK